ncbi:MAG: hypothetical protein AcusKO_19610 [Acuticoccus sp.]
MLMTEIAPLTPLPEAAAMMRAAGLTRPLDRFAPSGANAGEGAGMGERFEAAMLSPMIAAILPPEDSAVWGGNAGKLWRGLYADEIAAATARAGGVGIAALIDAAVASRAQSTQGGDQG